MKRKKNTRMPTWLLMIIDLLLIGASLCVFALFHHVLSTYSADGGTEVAQPDALSTFALPVAATTETIPEATTSPASRTSGRVNRSRDATQVIASDEAILSADTIRTTLHTYTSEQGEVTLYQIEVGIGSNKITYYVADLYLSSVANLQTGLAGGAYGSNTRDSVLSMAEDYGALVALSGDYYSNSESGVVIRNGVLYRDAASRNDLCVLFTDGTMATYAAGEYDLDAIIAAGAWQAWTFGPALLDGSGNILDTFNTTSYLNTQNPRAAIGYIAPGHYVLVLVDGRNTGYSRGATLSELAEIMRREGCLTAYNLDGGKSAVMVYDGQIIGQPDDGGRDISDIIYFGG